MEIELPILDNELKTKLQPKVRTYRRSFDALKRKVINEHENIKFKKDKDFLIGVHIEENDSWNNSRLGKHQEMIRKQNAALENAMKIGYEVDTTADRIKQELNDQNVKAAGTKGKVKEMTGVIDDSESVITRMLKREQCKII